MTKPMAKDKKAELHIRIDPDLLVRLKRVARRNLVGVNFVVNMALNDWLEEDGEDSTP